MRVEDGWPVCIGYELKKLCTEWLGLITEITTAISCEECNNLALYTLNKRQI